MNLNGLIRLANYLSEGNIAAAVSEGLVPDFSDILSLINNDPDNKRQIPSNERVCSLYHLENPYDIKTSKLIHGEWTAKIFAEEIPLNLYKVYTPQITSQMNFKPGYFINQTKKPLSNYWQALIAKSKNASINK